MADKNKQMKMAVISGASHALKYKELSPRASDAEILQRIEAESKKIIENIDKFN